MFNLTILILQVELSLSDHQIRSFDNSIKLLIMYCIEIFLCPCNNQLIYQHVDNSCGNKF